MTKAKEPLASDAESIKQKSPETKSAALDTPSDALTSLPTPTRSVRGLKRAHDDAADDRATDNDTTDYDSDRLMPHNDQQNVNKRLKVPETSSANDGESGFSNTDSGHSGPVSEDAPSDPSWPDILHRVRVSDEKSEDRRDFYSEQRYTGWSDPLKDDDKGTESPFEMIRHVVGSWQEDVKVKPKSMKKHQWKQNDKHINFEKDFNIEIQKRPAIRINDAVCRSIMKFLIKYDPGQILTGDSFVVHWPWEILMHYHEEIEALRDNIKNNKSTDFRFSEDVESPEIVRRIDILLNQVEDVYTGMVKPELKNHANSRLAEFQNLWLLFKPGEEVFARVNGELAAFIVLVHRNHEPGDSKTTKAPIKQFIVHVWNLHFVGGRLARHMSQIAIDEYEDSRLIETLPVYPCKYAGPEHEAWEQREKLIERGKKYFSIIKQSHAHMDHKGLTRDSEPRIYNGRVIIDPVSYVKYGSTKRSELKADLDWDWLKLRPRREENSIDYEPLKPRDIVQPEDNGGGQLWTNYNHLDPTDSITQKSGFLEDRHFLLFPRIIRGFSLRDKQWETYDVDSLSKINWCTLDVKHPFPGLILDEEKQKIVQANCRTAESRRLSPDLSADRIGGKGQGTVFLLDGPPGVGKTFTVECIANYTRQPLLSLSGCDIGPMENAELKVQHWFDLAKAWDALLLIDEADIFLTWRQPDNIKRNSLVSVFLRTIESFPGMLFLTTNRIGQLDLAINSRIDVAIHFDVFSFESQQKLWLQYFEEINKSGRLENGPYIKETVIDKFLVDEDVKMNDLSGREIRNAFKQAIKFARRDSVVQDKLPSEAFKVKLRHLKKAIENCKEKTRYILRANQVSSEPELAGKRMERQHDLVTLGNVDGDDLEVVP